MAANLHENLDLLAAMRGGRTEPEDYIANGLRQDYDLRPYQSEAFWNFAKYFETPVLRGKTNRTLFHMATGSGKTLIMAGLMLYLYKQGYRNFLFFVNSTNVVEKTKDNFLNPGSPKYLFSDTVWVDGQTVAIREVGNFQMSDPGAINICFTTIQGLHIDLHDYREGRMTFEDFEEHEVALISDEAHHINAATKRGLDPKDVEAEQTWESTVLRILDSHVGSLLVEFTATAPLSDPLIADKYRDSIVMNYPLRVFRTDGFSKEINLLQASLKTPMDRSLQALILSQHRLKLFQSLRQPIRPVVMLKSKSTADNKTFFEEFQEKLADLDGTNLRQLRDTTTAPAAKRAFAYFEANGITLDGLAAEIREDFSREHCLLIDSKNKKDLPPEYQIAVNTLETSAYRAVFAVDMLNEGWDVLTLFDIVRLFETQAGKGSRPAASTIAEAQLIGRGARYCPFTTGPGQDRFTRKYDDEPENPMRVCEELYFHSPAVSQYIDELRSALKETGALADNVVELEYVIKDEVLKSDLYRDGWVFANDQRKRNRDDLTELPDRVRLKEVIKRMATGASSTGAAFGATDKAEKVPVHLSTKKLCEISPAVMNTAMRRDERLRFDRLHELFPKLKTLREFATSPDYVGGIKLTLETRDATPSPDDWLAGASEVLRQVAQELEGISFENEGTREFMPRRLHEVITNKTIHASDPTGNGYGIAQSKAPSDELRLDLYGLDWYGHTENYGTPEEKAFLVYFDRRVKDLQKDYDLVLVLRNEGQVAIFDFATGRPFQPDFLLFLHEKKDKGYIQYQLFVEPKGDGFLVKDKWKEDLLRTLKQDNVQGTKTFADDNDYFVWGLPFFNQQPVELRQFSEAVDGLIRS